MSQPASRANALLMVLCFASSIAAQATDAAQSKPTSRQTVTPDGKAADKAGAKAPAGDPLKVNFTLPFKEALAKAKKENRLIFLKPIYGGVDPAGAKDYRCGSW